MQELGWGESDCARRTKAWLVASAPRGWNQRMLMFAVCEDADGWKIIKSKLSAT
jgi:hypothetical protein